ncbi:CoA transferase [Streptomyces sp. 1222.5]|uniref:CoA transferase n=1 Tax=Streptomyces sp. 1222.5 TaxID=1881026 RepID=UPI003EBF8231
MTSPEMRGHAENRLSEGGLRPLAEVMASIGVDRAFHGDAVLRGGDPLTDSPHKYVEAHATTELLVGACAAAVDGGRNGGGASGVELSVDAVPALHAMHTPHYVWHGRTYSEVGAEHVPCNGMFRTKDDRHVMFCAGPPYQKLVNGYLRMLECAYTRESVTGAVSQYTADELAEECVKAGVPGVKCCTPEEWHAHPQGEVLAQAALIGIEKIAAGPAVALRGSVNGPLGGVRVLDFTHVLAGPRTAQTLTLYGATSLHISALAFPDTVQQHLGVDVGKYCAYLDLRKKDEHATMLRLCEDADVFLSNYRGTVHQRYGLTPHELVERSSRGVIVVSINCYGPAGPWSGLPGFDPNAQAATGFCVNEGSLAEPRTSPVFYTADITTSDLAASGAMAALLRRAEEGGSFHVTVSLARSAMWVDSLGLVDHTARAGLPAQDTYPYETDTIHNSYGELTRLTPALQITGMPLHRPTRLVPYGADVAAWP